MSECPLGGPCLRGQQADVSYTWVLFQVMTVHRTSKNSDRELSCRIRRIILYSLHCRNCLCLTIQSEELHVLAGLRENGFADKLLIRSDKAEDEV